MYPALAVAAALPKDSPVLYVGSPHGLEADLIARQGGTLSFRAISTAALRGRAPWTMGRNLLVLVRGVSEAGRILADFAPQAVLVTGGYVSIPVGLAAWRRRVPLLLYLPDIVPGLAVRLLALVATRIATTVADSSRYLPRRKVVVTGYPVRPLLLQVDRRAARAHFGISAEDKVLLVAGGSRGARSINRAVGSALGAFLGQAVLIHICGWEEDERWLKDRVAEQPADLRTRYHLFRYLHDMPLALAAADVAICRSGASTLGELPAVGLPAVLVPYPYVHQEENADYLVRHGAAVKVPDDRLYGADHQPTAGVLLEALRSILTTPARYRAMVEAMGRLARPDAAQTMVEQLCLLAGE